MLIEQEVPHVTLVRFHGAVQILLNRKVVLVRAKPERCGAYDNRNKNAYNESISNRPTPIRSRFTIRIVGELADRQRCIVTHLLCREPELLVGDRLLMSDPALAGTFGDLQVGCDVMLQRLLRHRDLALAGIFGDLQVGCDVMLQRLLRHRDLALAGIFGDLHVGGDVMLQRLLRHRDLTGHPDPEKLFIHRSWRSDLQQQGGYIYQQDEPTKYPARVINRLVLLGQLAERLLAIKQARLDINGLGPAGQVYVLLRRDRGLFFVIVLLSRIERNRSRGERLARAFEICAALGTAWAYPDVT